MGRIRLPNVSAALVMTEVRANELHPRKRSEPDGYTCPDAIRLPASIIRRQSRICEQKFRSLFHGAPRQEWGERRESDGACQARLSALCSSQEDPRSRVAASRGASPGPGGEIGLQSVTRPTRWEGSAIKSTIVMVFIKCLDYCFLRNSLILFLTTDCIPVGEASCRLSPSIGLSAYLPLR